MTTLAEVYKLPTISVRIDEFLDKDLACFSSYICETKRFIVIIECAVLQVAGVTHLACGA